MELIKKYFPELKEDQVQKLEALKPLYEHWNSQINVISRKDMDSFYEHHVLHSLGIAKVAQFEYGSEIMDIGTGGGFPGIPLAICFPGCKFTLVDSIGKKIKVVNEVSSELKLENVHGIHERAEKVKGQFDHIVSRAVTQMPKFLAWTRGKIRKAPRGARLPHGIWYLKGGDLSEELSGIKAYRVYDLKEHFEEEFFGTKKVVFLRNQRPKT